MTLTDAPTTAASLRDRYVAIRGTTEALAAPLSPEDQQVQSMPDVSPTKWHRAHTTWFFETFLLQPSLPGYQAHDPDFGFLFNSYYEAVGPRHARPHRGLISRPSGDEVARYRDAVDEAMAELLDRVETGELAGLSDLIDLGLHHEQQHQELLLMDIKHVLSVNPTRPTYRRSEHTSGADPGPAGWVDHDGGVVSVGRASGDGFSFDNEGPVHDVLLRPFRLADRLVTAGDWLEFMADGGYRRAELWLSDGWYTVNGEGWDAPLYWFRDGDDWWIHTLTGVRPVDPSEPVVHVSGYEADAFASWAGARLPTEHEWELATRDVSVVEGNLLPADHLHPVAAATDAPGVRQLFGDVWEWTASPYVAYPGFRAAAGAVGEYNGKFMSGQMVLRGGCAVTPGDHVRSTYRNFFPPSARWAFGGLRLASEA
ncbi:MAG: ergothioneine biosynthesis protein EgtB [Actinomycetota bacterium]